MIDDATLAAIGTGIMGFGIVALVFRVQRELEGRERSLTRREFEVWERSLRSPEGDTPSGDLSLTRRELEVWERSLPRPAMRERRAVPRGPAGQWARWLPWADSLLIGAVTAAILLVLFPIALAGSVSSLWGEQLPAAACSGSAIALAGYIPALVAHYTYDFRCLPKWLPKWLQKPPMWLRKLIHAEATEADPEFAERVVAERVIVIASVVLGVAAAVGSFFLTS